MLVRDGSYGYVVRVAPDDALVVYVLCLDPLGFGPRVLNIPIVCMTPVYRFGWPILARKRLWYFLAGFSRIHSRRYFLGIEVSLYILTRELNA